MLILFYFAECQSDQCNNDGATFPDPSSCYNYYRCENKIAVKKTCRFGLVWNCFLKICTLKAFVPCCRYDPNPPPTANGCLNLGIKIPNPFQCNKYYECFHWHIVEKTCTNGNKFDWIKMKCVDSNGCRCAPGTDLSSTTKTSSTTIIPTTDSSLTTTMNTDSITTTYMTTDPEITLTTFESIVSTTEVVSDQCPYEGATYPDVKNCYNYYECSNGIPHRKTCPFNLVYNCFFKMCTLKAFAPCCRYDRNPPPNNDNSCFGWGIRVPNPFDCSKYYECVNKKIRERICKNEKKFDWIEMKCVNAEGCYCAPGSNNMTTTTKMMKSTDNMFDTRDESTTHFTAANTNIFLSFPTQPPFKTQQTITSAEQTNGLPNPCENATHGSTFPNTNHCNSYYRCENNAPILQTCPNGLVYNCFLKACTLRAFSPCCRNDLIQPKSYLCFVTNMIIPNFFECDKYFQCTNNKVLERSCSFGQKFDWLKMSCVNANGCHCAPGSNNSAKNIIDFPTTSTPKRKFQCSNNYATLPDTTSCYHYYHCVNGEKVRKKCPLNLFYHCFFKICTLKAFSPCCRYDRYRPINDNSCYRSGVKEANPFMCNKYYECTNYRIVERTCPSSKTWDWIDKKCVDANDSRCLLET